MRNMYIVAISAISLLAMSGSALALRGDNSEGNGGGSGGVKAPEFYHTNTIINSVANPNAEYTRSETVWHPAKMDCPGQTGQNKNQFDDFVRGCTYSPARSEVVQSVYNAGQPATIYQVTCAVGGTKVDNIVTYFNKKGQLKRNSTPTTMCKFPMPKNSSSDRGNSGNR